MLWFTDPETIIFLNGLCVSSIKGHSLKTTWNSVLSNKRALKIRTDKTLSVTSTIFLCCASRSELSGVLRWRNLCRKNMLTTAWKRYWCISVKPQVCQELRLNLWETNRKGKLYKILTVLSSRSRDRNGWKRNLQNLLFPTNSYEKNVFFWYSICFVIVSV